MSNHQGNRKVRYEWLIAHKDYVGDECLLWPFSCNTSGYGQLGFNYKILTASREMCRLTHGDPPPGKNHAAHSCGNRRCVNPAHISWKSPRDNQLDRAAHGTAKTTRAKLTRAKVEQIRQLHGVETRIETAAKYGVTESTIRGIQNGTLWGPNPKRVSRSP